MTAVVNSFALIGDSFPSDKFESLRQASVAARSERRIRRQDRSARLWSAVPGTVVMPKQLSA